MVLASGTPLVNTIGEAFNISRYLQEDRLRQLGLDNFDVWSETFGKVISVFEPDPSGVYKYVDRFAAFVNVSELSAIMQEVIDHVGPTELDKYVVRPNVKGGRDLVVVPMSDDQSSYQSELGARIRKIQRSGRPKKGDDNHLVVISDGRKMAIDMRLIDPDAPSDPDSKLNKMVSNIFKVWKETTNHPFYEPDQSTRTYAKEPSFHGPAAQIVFVSLGLKGDFSVPHWIRAELRRMGVPSAEIAYINDYKTSTARQRLFNDVNEGKVRVLVGHPRHARHGDERAAETLRGAQPGSALAAGPWTNSGSGASFGKGTGIPKSRSTTTPPRADSTCRCIRSTTRRPTSSTSSSRAT